MIDTETDFEIRLHWDPELKKYMYHLARLHYAEYGHAMGDIVRKQTFKWSFSPELIMAITGFVIDSTHNVAFGTYSIKDQHGKKTVIARVIREMNDSELTRQIQSFLQDQAFEIPDERTIKRILENMPAASQKALSGISQVLDDSRKAFALLISLVEFLRDNTRKLF